MSFKPRSFSEAKAAYKPLARKRMKVRIRANRKPLRAKPDRRLAAWGKAVLERDGWQCQWFRFPGSSEFSAITCTNILDPHHILPRGRRPDRRYDVTNGITLCRNHHNWVGDNPIEAEKIGLNSFESYEKALKEFVD